MTFIKFKTAEEWAKDYLNSEVGKREMELCDKEVLQYMLYGSPTRYLNENLLDNIKREYLDVDTIIERYDLTEKEIEDLNKLRRI